jgi:hypothetical protein
MFRVADIVSVNDHMWFSVVREDGKDDYRCCAPLPQGVFKMAYEGTDLWSVYGYAKRITADLDKKVIRIVI